MEVLVAVLSIVMLVILIGFLVQTCLVVVTIESQSMSPSLLEGDRVLSVRYWPARWLRRGDIVLVWPRLGDLKYNQEAKPFGVIPFIKRVTGLPGDKIVTHFNELDEYHKQKLRLSYDREGVKVWHIPSGHFFVRGDYPIGGFDSLTWGPIPFESLLGIAILKLPPLIQPNKHEETPESR